MEKHPLEIARDKRASTDTCPHCKTDNQDPNFKGFRFYNADCKGCGKLLDHSYLFAPWGMTWNQLQTMRDKFKEKYGHK